MPGARGGILHDAWAALGERSVEVCACVFLNSLRFVVSILIQGTFVPTQIQQCGRMFSAILSHRWHCVCVLSFTLTFIKTQFPQNLKGRPTGNHTHAHTHTDTPMLQSKRRRDAVVGQQARHGFTRRGRIHHQHAMFFGDKADMTIGHLVD